MTINDSWGYLGGARMEAGETKCLKSCWCARRGATTPSEIGRARMLGAEQRGATPGRWESGWKKMAPRGTPRKRCRFPDGNIRRLHATRKYAHYINYYCSRYADVGGVKASESSSFMAHRPCRSFTQKGSQLIFSGCPRRRLIIPDVIVAKAIPTYTRGR